MSSAGIMAMSSSKSKSAGHSGHHHPMDMPVIHHPASSLHHYYDDDDDASTASGSVAGNGGSEIAHNAQVLLQSLFHKHMADGGGGGGAGPAAIPSGGASVSSAISRDDSVRRKAKIENARQRRRQSMKRVKDLRESLSNRSLLSDKSGAYGVATSAGGGGGGGGLGKGGVGVGGGGGGSFDEDDAEIRNFLQGGGKKNIGGSSGRLSSLRGGSDLSYVVDGNVDLSFGPGSSSATVLSRSFESRSSDNVARRGHRKNQSHSSLVGLRRNMSSSGGGAAQGNFSGVSQGNFNLRRPSKKSSGSLNNGPLRRSMSSQQQSRRRMSHRQSIDSFATLASYDLGTNGGFGASGGGGGGGNAEWGTISRRPSSGGASRNRGVGRVASGTSLSEQHQQRPSVRTRGSIHGNASLVSEEESYITVDSYDLGQVKRPDQLQVPNRPGMLGRQVSHGEISSLGQTCASVDDFPLNDEDYFGESYGESYGDDGDDDEYDEYSMVRTDCGETVASDHASQVSRRESLLSNLYDLANELGDETEETTVSTGDKDDVKKTRLDGKRRPPNHRRRASTDSNIVIEFDAKDLDDGQDDEENVQGTPKDDDSSVEEEEDEEGDEEAGQAPARSDMQDQGKFQPTLNGKGASTPLAPTGRPSTRQRRRRGRKGGSSVSSFRSRASSSALDSVAEARGREEDSLSLGEDMDDALEDKIQDFVSAVDMIAADYENPAGVAGVNDSGTGDLTFGTPLDGSGAGAGARPLGGWNRGSTGGRRSARNATGGLSNSFGPSRPSGLSNSFGESTGKSRRDSLMANLKKFAENLDDDDDILGF